MFTEALFPYTELVPAGTPIDRETRDLLSRGPRLVDKRLAIILAILIFPLLIFCVSYIAVFGIYPSLIYPRVTTIVPEQSIHRAIVYNSIQNLSNKVDFIADSSAAIAVKNYKIVCYYTLPSSVESLQVDELDPYLCTHINAAFARVVNNSLHVEECQLENFKKLVELKSINKNLSILISVGGSGNDSGFPEMVSNHEHRKSFIKSVIDFAKTYKIDGVDLDWEFPNIPPGTNGLQRVHFTQLLGEIRKSINRRPNFSFLLTVAVAAPYAIVENSYDVRYMNEYVDFVNLMSYDYHFYTRGTPFTGINSPLYASDNEKYYLATMNINFSVNYWNCLGMEKSKIVVGLPTYGHTFRLANPRNNGTYAPAFGYGRLGSLGFVDFPQICQFLTSNQISPIFDLESKSPYASKDYEWTSFENSQSITYKAEYIRDNKFGGAMVWSLNSDDYKGLCQNEDGRGGKFPLVTSIKNVFMVKN